MILSDRAIMYAMQRGDIVIAPFDRARLGSNSYDVHLSEHIATYRNEELDAREDNPIDRHVIGADGLLLEPHVLYLASTVEYTETKGYVPYVDGKSSVGRLGIFIHATAGRGDSGFFNHWTLELSVVQPVRVYAGMPIGQLTYHTIEGEVEIPYDKKPSAKYNGVNPLPMPSGMHKNFPRCEVCGGHVREGLRFCPGMSPCFRQEMLRLRYPHLYPKVGGG
jgi:dCTP deaminase